MKSGDEIKFLDDLTGKWFRGRNLRIRCNGPIRGNSYSWRIV